MKEFDWIAETFVPIAQSKERNPDTHIAEKAIPHLKIRLGGVLQNTAPEQAPVSSSHTIQLNGIVQLVVPLPGKKIAMPDGDEDFAMEDNDSSSDSGDLSEKVEQFISKDIETDAEDVPDWMFEKEEAKSSDPNYVFCPAPHWKQILHMFTKHFCQHTLFAEHDGKWTAEQIHHNAVYEMYNFWHL